MRLLQLLFGLIIFVSLTVCGCGGCGSESSNGTNGTSPNTNSKGKGDTDEAEGTEEPGGTGTTNEDPPDEDPLLPENTEAAKRETCQRGPMAKYFVVNEMVGPFHVYGV